MFLSQVRRFSEALWNRGKLFSKMREGTSVPSSPTPRLLQKNPSSVALVLGGGGAKGLAHVAVLEEFEKAKIPIDLIVGCSSGTLIGALYADVPDAKRIKSILMKLKKKDFMSINFFRSRYGLGDGHALRKLLHKHLTKKHFEDLRIPLIGVAADLQNGELIALHEGEIIPAIHASCAVPFYFNPVVLQDRVLVDGGIIDPVPCSTAKEQNPGLVIGVDLNQTLAPALPSHLFGVAKRSWEIVLHHQSKQCLQEADIVINPAFGDVGTFEETRKDLLYESGREAALKAIPAIQKALEERRTFPAKVRKWASNLKPNLRPITPPS